MAKIIDVRSSGGQCIILGDCLTLPNFVSGTNPVNVMNGSVRLNAQTGYLELYSSINASPAAWQAVGSGQYLALSGGTVNGNVQVNGTMTATTFSGNATGVSHADLAERYHADAVYETGTVLVLGGLHEVTMSAKAGDIRVAGIVSSMPGVMLNTDAGEDATHPYIALKGRVPCKVAGRIVKGDNLMPSSIPGHATAAPAWANPLSIIGKALEDFDGALGIIEVKV